MQGLKRALVVVIDTHIWIWKSAGDLRIENFRRYRGRLAGRTNSKIQRRSA